MTYDELIDSGAVLIENEYPDYADVVLGLDDDDSYVALGYVHTERVITSIDLETDATTETTRWFAYDVTHGSVKVGRQHGGYGTREEAVMVLVDRYSKRLAACGFPLDSEVG